MRIKKHKNKNNYILTEDKIWVRDFTKNNTPFMDVNHITEKKDFPLFLHNELENFSGKPGNIDTEHTLHPKIAIVSNGYKFNEKQFLLSGLPNDVTILGTNRSLANWKLVGADCPDEKKRAMSYYVVNNPYPEARSCLPTKHRYYPKCIASTRTDITFLKEYRGIKYLYVPVPEEYYSGPSYGFQYKIDDYRNPICASIGLAYRFGVQKLLLFCCDDSFAEERPSSEKLENGLWCYPQQKVSNRIIDCNLRWLKNQDVKIGNHSSGINLDNATYINTEEVIDFFEDDV